MAVGPGKYDDVCSVARLSTDAEVAILIVVNGFAGTGFSVQARGGPMIFAVPDMLEHVAAAIRVELKAKPPA